MRLGRAGTEPLQARSAYGFRKALAWFGLACGAVGAVVFGGLAVSLDDRRAALTMWAILFVVLVLVAVLDLLVLRKRTRRHSSNERA